MQEYVITKEHEFLNLNLCNPVGTIQESPLSPQGDELGRYGYYGK